MSERGVFAVDRGIWEHDFLVDDAPLSRREAWLWLLSEAAWKERTRRIAGRVIELERGQVVASLRFIASKWRWSEPRVRRFLTGLIREQMIDAATDAGITVVTIRNYDNYQRVSLPIDAMRKDDDDASATQQRRKTEDIKTIEFDLDTPRGQTIATWPADWSEQFWAAYPLKVGRKKAIALLAAVRSKGEVDFPRLIAAVKAYAATADPNFTAHATTWINRGGWDDELKPRQGNGNGTGNHRTGGAAGQTQSGSDAILAGVAAATERRARERSAAGQQREAPRHGGSAASDDPELFGASDGREPH